VHLRGVTLVCQFSQLLMLESKVEAVSSSNFD
jgi:hypothetical protein